jgi:hypothetical protein
MAASSCTLVAVNGERNVTPFFHPNVSGRLRDLTGNEEFSGVSDVT